MDDKFFIKGYEAAGFKIRLVASFIDNVILMIPLLFIAKYFNIDTENNDLGSFLPRSRKAPSFMAVSRGLTLFYFLTKII